MLPLREVRGGCGELDLSGDLLKLRMRLGSEFRVWGAQAHAWFGGSQVILEPQCSAVDSGVALSCPTRVPAIVQCSCREVGWRWGSRGHVGSACFWVCACARTCLCALMLTVCCRPATRGRSDVDVASLGKLTLSISPCLQTEPSPPGKVLESHADLFAKHYNQVEHFQFYHKCLPCGKILPYIS